MLLPRRLAAGVVVVVSVVWVVNFAAQFFLPDYKPDMSINGIFSAVVGGALLLSRKGRDDGKGDDSDDGGVDHSRPPHPPGPPWPNHPPRYRTPPPRRRR